MSDAFVPVDLDQVLDDFEEQELKNDSPPKTSVKTKQNQLLEEQHETVDLHVRFPSTNEPRTYSFNNPLDAILEDHKNNVDHASGTSLAQELADYSFGSHNDDDDDDVHDDADGATHSDVGAQIVNDGNDSETASEASSTSAVIATAEKITEDSKFSLQENYVPLFDDSSKHPKSIEEENSFGLSLPVEDVAEKNNKPLEVEPDFLSLLNSVVEEKSLCLQDSKSQTASFSSFDGSTSSSNELTNEIKDLLVDNPIDTDCNKDEITETYDSKTTDQPGEKECSKLQTDLLDLKTVEDSTKLNNKGNICERVEEIDNHEPEERTLEVEKDGHKNTNKTNSIKNFEAYNNDLQGANLCESEKVVDDVDEINSDVQCNVSKDSGGTYDSSSTSRVTTDTNTTDGKQYFEVKKDEQSVTKKCIQSLDNENRNPEQEKQDTAGGLLLDVPSSQQNENNENLLLNVEPQEGVVLDNMNPNVLDTEGGLSRDVQPREGNQNDSNLLVDLESEEEATNCLSPIDSGSADSLCGTQDEDIEDIENQPVGSLTDAQSEQELPSESQLASKMTAVHISSGDPEMGYVPPIWVPDEVAFYCMTCGLKFSVIKRKHHCRACGKVLCSSCCNMKFPLPYMGNKDARVCQVCCDILIRGNQPTTLIDTLQTNTPTVNDNEGQNGTHEPANEDRPTAEMSSHVHTQPESYDEDELLNQVLERSDDNNEHSLAEDNLESTSPVAPALMPSDPSTLPLNNGTSSSASLASAPLSPTLSDDSDISFRLDVEHVRALIPQEPTALPPILNVHKKSISIKEHPDPAEIMFRLKGQGETVIFLLNKNLIVKVKIVKLRCCVKKKCWCFVSDGMGAASQEEMTKLRVGTVDYGKAFTGACNATGSQIIKMFQNVVLLECEHNENTVPKDVLSHFNTAFTYANQGHVVSDLGFTIFGQPFLGSSNNAGFLYIKPSFQCLENLPLPSVPYVVGVLIQRQEAPWAQLFPLRLMLRLGTEFRYYPCPLWSVRNRQTVYGEIGHTIMNLLTDFKNFQYSIPRVTGLTIHMEDTKTTVRMPQDRYDEIVKVLNAAEEHMFSFGANFSSEADSHLVCIQEGDNYKTQAINIQNKTRKVTGASFIVFTGSLKTSNPNDAKVSIIEDGLMIQMLPDAILELRKALREMQDYVIQTGSNTPDGNVNKVSVEWTSRDTNKQIHISPIDGRSLTDVPNMQVHSSCDFTKHSIYRIRWTNVFLGRNVGSSRGLASRSLSLLTAELARACCEALRPHLAQLFEQDLKRLSLRVNIDADSVEYSIGAKGKPLPVNLMADLDSALVPAINTAATKHRRGPLTVELFFNVISLS